MISFMAFPFPIGWIIGIPLAIIVGVGISAISLWTKSKPVEWHLKEKETTTM